MIRQLPSRLHPSRSSLLRTFTTINGTHSTRRPQLISRTCTIFPPQRCYATHPLLNSSLQTTRSPEAEFSPEDQTPPPPPPPPKQSRKLRLRRITWALLGFLVGMAAGRVAAIIVSPPPMPDPGSPNDILLVKDIQSRAANIPIVKELSASPDFESWDAYSGFEGAGREKHFSTGVLGGARGIGAYQRIFWNQSTGEVVSVFWVGISVNGWPGVTHGGLLATVLDEALARCAMLPRKAGGMWVAIAE